MYFQYTVWYSTDNSGRQQTSGEIEDDTLASAKERVKSYVPQQSVIHYLSVREVSNAR